MICAPMSRSDCGSTPLTVPVGAHRHEDSVSPSSVIIQAQAAAAGQAFGGDQVELQHGARLSQRPVIAPAVPGWG